MSDELFPSAGFFKDVRGILAVGFRVRGHRGTQFRSDVREELYSVFIA